MNNEIAVPNEVYPMRVVSRLTGLSADTIRVWERRYQAVDPGRTDGNKRRYSVDHVRRLVLLRRATELGHSIGQVARLRAADLRRIIGETDPAASSQVSVYQAIIDDYMKSVLAFDLQGADAVLTRSAAIIPPMQLTLQVIVPLMRSVGAAWHQGDLKISHEHIVTAQLRSLLGTLMRHIQPVAGAPRVLVTTPPGHRHEFGAIIGAFIAASRGFEPIYIGADTPIEDISDAAIQSGAALILLSVARDSAPRDGAALVEGIATLCAEHEVWVGIPEGHAASHSQSGARFFHHYEDLDQALLARQS